MGQGMEGKAGHDGNFFLEITPRDRSFFPHFSADRVSRRADLSETPMGPRKFSHVLFAHFFIFVSKDIVAGLWAIAPSGQEEEGQGKSFTRLQGRGGEGILWCNLPTSLITMDGVVVGGGRIYFLRFLA